jgi:arginyl-tRNA--protein-N-Asp/Glu arginylyltransferase
MRKTWPKVFQNLVAKRILKKFVTIRILELYENISHHDPECVRSNEKFSQETKQLIAELGPEKFELYQKYESALDILIQQYNHFTKRKSCNISAK